MVIYLIITGHITPGLLHRVGWKGHDRGWETSPRDLIWHGKRHRKIIFATEPRPLHKYNGFEELLVLLLT